MLIFLDTEFTDFAHGKLISIGFAAENGQQLYLECEEFSVSECSEFVREMVLPLLSNGVDVLCNKNRLKNQILDWFSKFRDVGGVVVVYDYDGDWRLLCDAINYEVPAWISNANIYNEINDLVMEQFFIATGLKSHHALNDAKAMMFAYRPH